MKVIRISLFVLLAIVSRGATAGSTVYTCKTDAGVVYQDHPCATDGATVASKDFYAPQPRGSSKGTRNGNAWADAVDGDQSDPVSANRQSRVIEESADEGGGNAGYQCEGNGKRWIQSKPCPPSTKAVRQVTGIDGTDQYGNHFSGSGTIHEQVPVTQKQLDHDELCTRVRDRESTSDRKASPSDAYERNKMRQQEGC